jgi:hypothetical protein
MNEPGTQQVAAVYLTRTMFAFIGMNGGAFSFFRVDFKCGNALGKTSASRHVAGYGLVLSKTRRLIPSS